jgi:23S rRNA (pseudouridine1915-N3)-methyltransferase
MRVIIAAVGRPKDGALAAAIREYEGRAARYWPLDVVEVREERGGGGVTPAVVMEREGERLRDRLAPSAMIVVCDPAGETLDSPALAHWLQRARERARDVAFVIGGAHGVSPALRDSAAMRFSLSALTFPHELARLMLTEQLYRAGTIVRGEPYHK